MELGTADIEGDSLGCDVGQFDTDGLRLGLSDGVTEGYVEIVWGFVWVVVWAAELDLMMWRAGIFILGDNENRSGNIS